MVTFASTTTVKNALIYLNDFGLLTIDNNITPTLFDIAYYLSAFEVIITTPKAYGTPTLSKELELIQLVNSMNPNTKFYLYIDGRLVTTPSTSGGVAPSTQINDLINNVINSYTLVGSNTIMADGVYVDYFNFPNVSATTLYSDTYRDVQIEAQNSTQVRNLYFAFSCQPESTKSTWYKCTNLPQVINDVPYGSPANKPIFFNSRNMLVTTNLFGEDFIYVGSSGGYSMTGWASRSNFFYDVLIINSIVTNAYNLNMQVLLAVTAHNPTSYNSVGFFTPISGGTNPLAAAGVAQQVLSLAYWLNYQYVATSAYPDFYLSETTDLVNYIFSYDTTAAAQNYNQRGALAVYNSNIIRYALLPSTDYLIMMGTDTGSLQIANNAQYNTIIIP